MTSLSTPAAASASPILSAMPSTKLPPLLLMRVTARMARSTPRGAVTFNRPVSSQVRPVADVREAPPLVGDRMEIRRLIHDPGEEAGNVGIGGERRPVVTDRRQLLVGKA